MPDIRKHLGTGHPFALFIPVDSGKHRGNPRIEMRDKLDTRSKPSSYKAAILIWLGLWTIILAFIAHRYMALTEIPAADVTYVPTGPPETLPQFVPPETTVILVDEEQPSTSHPSSTATTAPEAPLPTVTPGWVAATSPPTRMVAPSIGLDSPVVPVGWYVEESEQGTQVVWEVASYAAGWHVNSAYPANGGNIVLSGHNNTAGEVFRYLMDLERGDQIRLYADDTVYPYTVVGKMLLEEKGMPLEIRRQNAQWIAPTDDERLTLVTCWPYSTYTHRLIIIASPIR